MAKKGGVQQLQADIQTDEDFEKFLERPGLLVLDIYSEWCGPCLGMVGSLRKIKLEIGGDNLHLAICKSDSISYLKRFCKKSEPTWMFVTNGKATNLLFGSNTPKLMKLIAHELEMLSKPNRNLYDITELQPEEESRLKIKQHAEMEALNKEEAAKQKKRIDYLNSMTDIIIENIPDMGVTVFGPHINRDMYKKLLEPAENMKLQCKDRRVINVSRADFDVVNYACPNPLPDDVMEQLDQKDLMMCFWKMPEDDRRPIPEVLNQYAHELMVEHHEVDVLTEEDIVHPPIILPLDLTIEVELEEGEVWEEPEPEPEPEPLPKKTPGKKEESAAAAETVEGEEDEGEEGSEGDEGGEGAEAGEGPEAPDLPELQMDAFDADFDLNDEEEEGEQEAEPEEVEVVVQKRYRKKIIRIPPIWVAGNARTHATLIYVFFRQQTTGFLPPDPTPEPPHIVMAFDAYKKRDLLSVAERLKDDVPLYGFFTSDEADEAKLIANSVSKYATMPQNPSDKIVFKVNKQTSNTMLSLATYGPSYVSADAVIGHAEALKFFPDTYKTAEQEAIEEAEREAENPKKKKRRTKVDEVAEPAVATSGEDSSDSRPATAPEESDVGEAAAAQIVEDGEAPPEGAPATEIVAPPAAEASEAADAATSDASPPAPAEGETPAEASAAEENVTPAE
ncbi:uncharacterized protein LOC128860615 [Anastrepha ludens]|uniref:uncharacterized protein LOC128860615 n=1 Tax=Anastrepha ludens TaxID=28586 RepID=UPI0023B0DCFC|nr:uncharacterized protein LOC128860615 [Anastrepha ludens]